MSAVPRAALDALAAAVEQLMVRDRRRLEKRLARLRRRPDPRALARLREDVDEALARVRRRAGLVPLLTYPEALPVSQAREAILEALAEHPVIVVCGETGSGKTTQLPKLCLEAGRGVRGLIGHTQPRRIAARSVARRLQEELGDADGRLVGHKVRFTDRTGPDTLVKLMTDGILLAETEGDRDLAAYDTLIIDEAHERSLNIDFLLGYLKRLLPRRPDLKLIITSATIDPDRFARHFGGAPVIHVEGRSYPVEVRYRPLKGEDLDAKDRDLQQGVVEAVDELARHGPGDILVFLPGEREIRETAEALRKHHPAGSEILPLYARLSQKEQDRIFHPRGGARRIVLATNVAETSLTVPGIRYVVDSGYARISRYSPRSKVQRLPIEPISRASADQRKGRCGRLGPGVCIRLYSEDDYLARPAHTDPEILRTNLAAVVLRMHALRLGAVDDFPFLDAPDPRAVKDAYHTLFELGAMDAERRLTSLGRRLARLPVDPRIGRMILAAEREDCLREVLVIASALSIQDPRERPLEKRAEADALHARFHRPGSDLLAWLALWDYAAEQSRHLSQNQWRKRCRAEYLSYVRLREWREVHGQLKRLAAELGLKANMDPAEPDRIHRALLTGLLGQVAMKTDEGDYLGPRNRRLRIHPASALADKGPRWIMAAELIDTQRLYASGVAAIRPEWIEELGAHLVQRHWFEPHWQKRAGRVAAFERVTLFGLVLTPRRRINYGPKDPKTAREIFIREALVHGHYATRAEFFHHNRRLLEEVAELEAKARRRDILVDEETLFQFYDQRLPADVYDARRFERWRKAAEAKDPKILFLRREDLMRHAAAAVTGERFPDHLEVAGLVLPLAYHFEPGHEADGVTARIPLVALGALSPEPFEWLVPGLIEEKVTALIRALPKALRRHFVPAPDFARAALEGLAYRQGALIPALGERLRRMTGVSVPAETWAQAQAALPEHLRMRFEVVDEDGRVVAAGRDLAALRRWQGAAAGERVARLGQDAGLERDEVCAWDFGPLPEVWEGERGGLPVRAWPALVDEDGHVALRLRPSPEAARADHRRGLVRLFALHLKDKLRYLQKDLEKGARLQLLARPVGGGAALVRDLLDTAVERLALEDGDAWSVRDHETFQARLAAVRPRLVDEAQRLAGVVRETLEAHQRLRQALKGRFPPDCLESLADLQGHLEALVHPGFVGATPARWLVRLPVYLEAARLRLEKLPRDPRRDAALARQVGELQRCWRAQAAARPEDPRVQDFRWLLEELRVSLFAQQLGTVEKVSVPRLEKRLQEIAA